MAPQEGKRMRVAEEELSVVNSWINSEGLEEQLGLVINAKGD